MEIIPINHEVQTKFITGSHSDWRRTGLPLTRVNIGRSATIRRGQIDAHRQFVRAS